MKKIFLTFFLSLFLFVNFANAEIVEGDDKIDIDFFYSKTCGHCASANLFLNEVSLKDESIKVNKFDISEKRSVELLNEYYNKYNVEEIYRGGVPVIFIENYYFVGFQKDFSEENINKVIDSFLNNEDVSDHENISNFTEIEELKSKIEVPFLGTINLKEASPFVFSAFFGFIDGFNACAMAALAFLLAVLIGVGDKRKLILLGGIFILVSGLVYYFFIAAWLNIFLLLPHLQVITYGVGILILILGIYILKEYFNGIICKLCDIDPRHDNWFSRNQKKLLLKMQEVINSDRSIFLIIGGIIFVAVGINTIELICSFGLPVAFTKILTSYNLSSASYYFYLLIYDIFYMLDDFVIFLIAVFTFNLAQESEKYIKISKFISGVLLIILGIIIIFFPNVLGSI